MRSKINNPYGIYRSENRSKKLRAARNARYRDNYLSSQIDPMFIKKKGLQQELLTQTTFEQLSSIQNSYAHTNELEQHHENALAEPLSTTQRQFNHELRQADVNGLDEELSINTCELVNIIDDDDELKMDEDVYDKLHSDEDVNEIEIYSYDEMNVSFLEGKDDFGNETDLNDKYEEKTLSIRDISVILCLIKRRHKCTNQLIVDILKLLNKVVPNSSIIPKSIYDIRKLLNLNVDQAKKDERSSQTIYICQLCETVQLSNSKCSNASCNIGENYLRSPYVYTWFNVREQLEQIIEREKNMMCTSGTDTIMSSRVLKNIVDGRLYKHMIHNEKLDNNTKLFTLSLSTDGVQLASNSSKSLWLITMTINEIDVKHRFLLNNVIIGGINSCFRKPTRNIMSLMMKPIVQQLQLLEQGGVCEIQGEMHIYKGFLIGCINDKPANSLVQNIPEPNAEFGCSKCEIQGITAPSNSILARNTKKTGGDIKSNKINYIRVFPTSFKDTPVRLRSSENYKQTVRELELKLLISPNLSTQERYKFKKGYLGPCSLDRLSYFDLGQGFLSDTLHTVYGGAMKRLLTIFFERRFCTNEKQWTIQSDIDRINKRIQQYITPSSTIRLPRHISLYSRYKASEYRAILLIYYRIFENILPDIYYSHFKQLVFAMHIGENQQITKSKLEEMHILLQHYVHEFKTLYGMRHIVNNIHSLIHLAETVTSILSFLKIRSDYSVYVIGGITSTVNGTKNQEKEIYNNLQMLKESCYLATISESSLLYELMIQNLGIKYNMEKNKDNRCRLNKIIAEVEQEQSYSDFDRSKINFTKSFSRCVYNNVKYDSYNINKKDCAILYRDIDNNRLQYALIDKFIKNETDENPVFFQVFDLINWHYDFIYVETMKFECENVLIGELNNCSKQISPSTIVEKVFSCSNSNEITFIRLPNLTESS
ncbi:unnamed protein product [Rotaria sp. Silwood2]|nr:unnamed protein product [Rotaria sp. Silwood2]CAF4466616.1 unnamed protein product [Rotaria sp. Silwood2]